VDSNVEQNATTEQQEEQAGENSRQLVTQGGFSELSFRFFTHLNMYCHMYVGVKIYRYAQLIPQIIRLGENKSVTKVLQKCYKTHLRPLLPIYQAARPLKTARALHAKRACRCGKPAEQMKATMEE
jgi:hypothetical protein